MDVSNTGNLKVKSLTVVAGFTIAPTKPCKAVKSLIYPGLDKEQLIITGYALFPDIDSDNTSGTLEDFCLTTLLDPNKEKLLSIVDATIKTCTEQVIAFTRPHKNKLHTYLSLTNDFVGLKIGESANANAFDFHCKELDPLKDMLQTMLEDC